MPPKKTSAKKLQQESKRSLHIAASVMLLVISMLLKPLFWGDGYGNTKIMNGSGPILSAVSHVVNPLAFDPYTIGLVSVAWCLAMFFMRNVTSQSLFGTLFCGGMASCRAASCKRPHHIFARPVSEVMLLFFATTWSLSRLASCSHSC